MLSERIESWEQQWEKRGIDKGRQEGQAKSLLTFLEARFGPLDETLRTQVSEMDVATLETLIERAAKADSLEEALSRKKL